MGGKGRKWEEREGNGRKGQEMRRKGMKWEERKRAQESPKKSVGANLLNMFSIFFSLGVGSPCRLAVIRQGL